MRLVTFVDERGGEPRIGAETERGVIDLSVAIPALPRTMLPFLAAGESALQSARAAVARGDSVGLLGRERVRLLAPLPRPGKIFGIALNYRDHAKETGKEIPEVPLVFSKAATAVIGPGDAIEIPPVSSHIDYEGELAVVVGKRAKRVAREDALQYAGGYTIMNDVTARDYQVRSGHCIGKSFDTFAPMGPALVTPDEIDPGNLGLRTFLNGEQVQHSNTNQLIFDVAALIAYISGGVTLEPGDVITTGTPSGVGIGRNPPRFLRAGDTVRIEISGIGALENTVTGA